MLKSRLNINGTDVGFSDILSISTNYLIADVRDPNKRNANYSKTITVPGTEEVNRLFQFIFDVNVDLTTFDPNLKIPATYFVNEVPVFSGDLQLLKVIKKETNGVLYLQYECFIMSTNSDLFLDIGDSLLQDIDISDLDHVFNDTSDKYNPTYGTGYYYGLIDYGMAGGNSTTWRFNHLKPAVFEKEYLDRIFQSIGKTYTSSFLNSDYYKHIIIPDVSSGPLMFSSATIENNQFYAGRTTTDTGTPVNGSYQVVNNYWLYYTPGINIKVPIEYDNDTTPPFNDPGNVYNPATFLFTVDKSSYYQVVAKANITVVITPPSGAASMPSNIMGTIVLILEKSINGGSTWGTEASHSFVLDNTMFTPDSPVTEFTSDNILLQAAHASMICNSGDILRARLVTATNIQAVFWDVSNTPITVGSTDIRFDFNVGTEFYANMNPATIEYGETVEMNNTIPRDVKQIDFLTSIIKCENLYIEQDKLDPDNYVIEPREEFYTGDIEDWTNKIDISQPQYIVPLGELSARKYWFKYKEDQDVFNKKYQDEYKEPYGSWDVNVNNDFIKDTKTVEVIFSGTPMSGNYTNDIVAPVLAKERAVNVYEPMRCNIRRLWAGGLLPTTSYTWEISQSGSTSSSIKTEYPYIGHLDSPTSPTIDLNFGIPFKVYWKIPSQTYSDNNRFNERYSKYITEITDKNSKVVMCNAKLTEVDINTFSFQKKVFIRDAYYVVNKIEGYDPQTDGIVNLELLKIQEGPAFQPDELSIGDNDISTDLIAVMPGGDGNGNAVVPCSQVFGSNNNVMGSGSLVIGDNNSIGVSSK